MILFSFKSSVIPVLLSFTHFLKLSMSEHPIIITV